MSASYAGVVVAASPPRAPVRRCFLRSLGVSVFLLALAASASAEDQVVVRGKKPSTLAASATEGEMPRETTDLASLIAPLPGVYVSRQGADDSLSTLSIRGTSPQEAAVYVAGVPVTGGGDPAMDLSLLPVWPGLRARVYRTFAPASLGRPALGGALVLDAPTLAAEPGRTDVYAGGGSLGVAKVRTGQLARIGAAKVAVATFGTRADNHFSYLDPVASSVDRPVFRRRENAGHAAAGAILEAAIPVALPFTGKKGTLTATTYGQWRRQQIPGTVRLPTPHQEVESVRSLGSLDLSVPFGRGEAHAQVYQRYDTLTLRDREASARLTGSPARTDDAFLTLGLRSGVRQNLGARSALGVHVDGTRESYLPGARVLSSSPDPAGRSSVGLAGELESTPASNIKGALHGRIDGWTDFGEGQAVQKTVVLPTGHFTLEAKLGEHLAWVGRIGRTARAPSFLERYGNQGVFVGEPALRPESAWTQDAGLRAKLGKATRIVQLELVGFHTRATDLIQFVPQGAFGRARASNLGDAELGGLELLGQGRWGPLDLRVVYNFLVSANRTECDAGRIDRCEAPPLPGRPRHNLGLDAGVRLGPLTLRYGLDVMTGMLADRVGAIRVPARSLHNAGVRVQLPRSTGLTLGADLRNIGNVRSGTYAGAFGPAPAPIGDQYDYPLPGRTLFVFARFSSATP